MVATGKVFESKKMHIGIGRAIASSRVPPTFVDEVRQFSSRGLPTSTE